jgi:peroxiredoxin
MTKNKKPAARSASKKPRSAGIGAWWKWAALAIPIAALATVMVLGARDDASSGKSVGSQAKSFTLPSTHGGRVSLEDILKDGAALLFFSMGLGCDGCFTQIPEVEANLARLGITLVPIMVDPAPLVDAEARRFGIDSPILIDANRSISKAYGMLGIYGHPDRPSHSFALVDRMGEILWVRHYAEMFVPAGRLVADLIGQKPGQGAN